MKNASDYAKRLNHLLKELRKKAEVDPGPGKPDRGPVDQIIHGFMTWNAAHSAAEQAYSRITRNMVDLNDLRVTDPSELAETLGPRYPRGLERADRLIRVLNAIYIREYSVDLRKLTEMAKRDARAYLDGLDGMVPHVSASVVLLTLDGHAMPVDDELYEHLKDEGVIDESATLEETQGFLEHHIPAAEAVEAYHLLRAWLERSIDVNLPGRRSGSGTTKKPTKKTPTKKTPTKKTPTKKKPTRK